MSHDLTGSEMIMVHGGQGSWRNQSRPPTFGVWQIDSMRFSKDGGNEGVDVDLSYTAVGVVGTVGGNTHGKGIDNGIEVLDGAGFEVPEESVHHFLSRYLVLLQVSTFQGDTVHVLISPDVQGVLNGVSEVRNGLGVWVR